MRITADDWHFRGVVDGTVVFDLFLDNGQHALLEVNPMWNQHVVNGDIPEIVVFCELPGERLQNDTGTARWLSRPPERRCSWSNVELPPALWQQIKNRVAERMALGAMALAGVADAPPPAPRPVAHAL
jgi:hypothetical protein